MTHRPSRLRPLVRPTLAMLAACLPLSGAHAAAPIVSSATPVKAVAYGNLPLTFEANAGQTDPQVKFLARGKGYGLFLTKDQAVFAFRQSQTKQSALRLHLVGASGNTQPQSQKPLPGTVNYFRGKTASVTHVPTFAAIAYPGVYPGTDLVYYGSQKQLEYDFRLAPKADPARIRLAFDGASKVAQAKDGGLSVSLPGGSVQWHAPVAYQDKDGQRVPVASRYVVTGTQVAFALGAYDHSKPLTIDPVLLYSTYLGGNANDAGKGITVDSSGNAYVTGYTVSASFPTTAGAYSTTYNSTNAAPDAFVTKLSADGSSLVYSTYLGGSGSDVGQSITVDPSGEAVVLGNTTSTDFPTTANAYQSVNKGGQDAFVTKLSADGSSLLYSTLVGGSADEIPHSIVLDSEGNAYFTGYTLSSDFPHTKGAYHGQQDIIAVELNALGTNLVYSFLLGGSGTDVGRGIALDSSNNAYITGYTRSRNLFTTPGAYQRTYGGGEWDAFIIKLNSTGTNQVYATYVGGSDHDAAEGIAVDSAGEAVISLHSHSNNYPVTAGAYVSPGIPTGNGDANLSLTKMNAAGNALIYAALIGGFSDDGDGPTDNAGGGIGLDADGNAYVLGYTRSHNYPVTPGAAQASFGGKYDMALSKLNPQGSILLYSTFLGGTNVDMVYDMALDANQNVYVTGSTTSIDYPTTQGAFNQNFNASGMLDGFVAKFSTTPLVFSPIADAYVRDGSAANTNNGATTTLKASSDGVSGSGNNRQTYLKFDLTSVPATAQKVAVRVWGALNTTGSQAYAIYSVPDTTWTERGITFNNKPATDANPLSQVKVTGNAVTAYDLDVTAYVLAQKAAGASKASFAIIQPTPNGTVTFTFNSREATTNQPTLIINN